MASPANAVTVSWSCVDTTIVLLCRLVAHARLEAFDALVCGGEDSPGLVGQGVLTSIELEMPRGYGRSSRRPVLEPESEPHMRVVVVEVGDGMSAAARLRRAHLRRRRLACWSAASTCPSFAGSRTTSAARSKTTQTPPPHPQTLKAALNLDVRIAPRSRRSASALVSGHQIRETGEAFTHRPPDPLPGCPREPAPDRRPRLPARAPAHGRDTRSPCEASGHEPSSSAPGSSASRPRGPRAGPDPTSSSTPDVLPPFGSRWPRWCAGLRAPRRVSMQVPPVHHARR